MIVWCVTSLLCIQLRCHRHHDRGLFCSPRRIMARPATDQHVIRHVSLPDRYGGPRVPDPAGDRGALAGEGSDRHAMCAERGTQVARSARQRGVVVRHLAQCSVVSHGRFAVLIPEPMGMRIYGLEDTRTPVLWLKGWASDCEPCK